MDNIFKVSSDKSNTYICKYCYSYIESNRCKSIFVRTQISDKDKKYSINKSVTNITSYISNSDIKCYICDRFIKEINSGPNIINYITNHISDNNLILNIARYKVWYFNDIYDNFGYYLRDRFKFTHAEIKNINQAISELYALPNINIINEKAEDIYNLNLNLNLP